MPIPIEPLQQVFMLFYAIFWGAIANVQPRWKPFQWHLFFAVPQARRRAIAAFGLLNVLPLIFFAYGMWALYGRDPTDTSLMAGSLHYLIRGVVPAFAIFGLYRFWFAIVELYPDCFYASTSNLVDERYRHAEPTYRRTNEERGRTTVAMVEQVHHPAFPQPTSTEARFWRYLTASKFKWLVNESRLFMPSAAHLGDPLEGTQPKGDANYWRSLVDRAASDEQRRTIEHNHQLISRFAAAFRTRYYVSCWHVNEAISPEMWKLYADSSDSVAVRTTYAKLRSALPAYVELGLVRYVDYAVDRLPTLNMLEYITHKSKVFEREQELRAVAMHPVVEGFDQQHFRTNHFEAEDNPEFRVFAPPVELSEIIESTFVHPEASEPFFQEVRSLYADHGLPIPERAAW